MWNAGKDTLLQLQRELPKPKKQFSILIPPPWDRAYKGRLEDQMKSELKEAEDWERRAMLAVQQNQDELAKQALMRRGEHVSRGDQLHEIPRQPGSGGCHAPERDSRADDRNGEPDEERDQQLRGHCNAVLGSRPIEHEAGCPFEDCARAGSDQAATDEEQCKARGRKPHAGRDRRLQDRGRPMVAPG